MADHAVVFYSWQSDLPNPVNRGFILHALEKAAKTIRNDDSIAVEPVIERDTQNVPGSPQIADAIFNKIASADVFVADVSFIVNGTQRRKDRRPCPNPNVLVELGFAARALGWDRIVLVMNTHFGPMERLPFDLRMRRTLAYNAPPDQPEKADIRRELEGRIESTLREILKNARPPVPSFLVGAIASIEAARPDQSAVARDFMNGITEGLVLASPERDPSRPFDELLVEGLRRSIPVLTDFGRLCETVARHDALDAALGVTQGFERILARYNYPPRQSGSYSPTDFDFYKFVGHEAYVMLVAALMRNDRWTILAKVLRERFTIETNTGREARSFGALSKHIQSLETRNQRLNRGLASLHAQILHERHLAEPLNSVCPFSDFIEADWFLFLRSDLLPDVSPIEQEQLGSGLWRPWSCVYAEEHGVPQFLARMQQRHVAERLMPALGFADIEVLRERYRTRANDLRRLFQGRDMFFEPPVIDADLLAKL